MSNFLHVAIRFSLRLPQRKIILGEACGSLPPNVILDEMIAKILNYVQITMTRRKNNKKYVA
jgi:hypothetical protein